MENKVQLKIKRDTIISIRLIVFTALAAGFAIGLIIGARCSRW